MACFIHCLNLIILHAEVGHFKTWMIPWLLLVIVQRICSITGNIFFRQKSSRLMFPLVMDVLCWSSSSCSSLSLMISVTDFYYHKYKQCSDIIRALAYLFFQFYAVDLIYKVLCILYVIGGFSHKWF